jgi:hypothetical protein
MSETAPRTAERRSSSQHRACLHDVHISVTPKSSGETLRDYNVARHQPTFSTAPKSNTSYACMNVSHFDCVQSID